MNDPIPAESISEEYRTHHILYEDFSDRLNILIRDILALNNLRSLPVESRAKTPSSLKGKVERSKGVIKKLSDVKDLAGVRVITFVESDIKKIEDVLKSVFEVHELDEANDRLGTDQVGYRSHHLTISLSENRLVLPEFARFRNLVAELQIRTVLQHAWAQIGHDQVYKSTSILPSNIKRNFQLLAGLLEIADNEFTQISHQISTYEADAAQKTASGDLKLPIDSVTLRQYLTNRFSSLNNLEPKFGPRDDMAEDLIEELHGMNIETIEELDAIIDDVVENYERSQTDTNFAGVLRTIMIYYDAEKYFDSVWKESWTLTSGEKFSGLGIDLSEIIKKHPTLL